MTDREDAGTKGSSPGIRRMTNGAAARWDATSLSIQRLIQASDAHSG